MWRARRRRFAWAGAAAGPEADHPRTGEPRRHSGFDADPAYGSQGDRRLRYWLVGETGAWGDAGREADHPRTGEPRRHSGFDADPAYGSQGDRRLRYWLVGYTGSCRGP